MMRPDRWLGLCLIFSAIAPPGGNLPANEPPLNRREPSFEERRGDHWAWKPIVRPMRPALRDRDWPREAIDDFILARLEAERLKPAPDADRATWLRRVSIDLGGVPPSRTTLEDFLADDSPQAHEKIVDRLLASPAFGERWGVHWLDLVRYSETKGHESDFPIFEAYRYRDYVIRMFNADVPYDRIVHEHIAGDLLETPRIDPATRTLESIQGTGFWHLGEATHSPVDIRGEEADRFANELEVFGKTFLGVGLGCARCHDHKFDPLQADDYYALYGYLQSSSYYLADIADPKAQEQARVALQSLRHATKKRVVESYTASLARHCVAIPRYLAAALEIQKDPDQGLQTFCSSKALRPAVLSRWVEHLEVAAKDISDPLHAFALIGAQGPEPRKPDVRKPDVQKACADADLALRKLESNSHKRFREQLCIRTVQDGERNYVTTKKPFSEDDVVTDFDRPRPGQFIAAGLRFGEAPARAGDIVLQKDPAKLLRILTRGEASSDRGGSARFSGMLRTATFEVTSNTLWYEARGEADVFLAVDSHRTVYGPLHGAVKSKIKGKDRYEWYSHDVREYIGHRVHVEFRPRNAGFALRRVRFAEGKPREIHDANRLVLKLLDDVSGQTTTEDLAEAFGQLFAEVVKEVTGGQMADTGDARDKARLFSWLIDHQDLLDSEDPAAPGDNEETTKRTQILAIFQRGQAEIEKRIPAAILAPSLLDGSAENEPVHLRGDHRSRGSENVERRFFTVLGGASPKGEIGSGRLSLAKEMTALDNPLLRRVIVNRLWHHLFGRGIVSSVDDFGKMGTPPTHPELLDYLACVLVDDDWSLKRMIRRMVLSSTYRMSSRPSDVATAGAADGAEAADPNNEWLHRMRIRRMTAEAIRDSILFVSGRLRHQMHGPSVKVHITPFMRHNRSPGGSGPADSDGRRSIYIEVRRNHLSHFLTAFDRPIPFTAVGKRNVSNNPAQPLILLNDPFVHQQAAVWAQRILARTDWSAARRVEEMYYDAFSRAPSANETRLALAFIAEQTAADGGNETSAWKHLAHTLLNVKAFYYVQ